MSRVRPLSIGEPGGEPFWHGWLQAMLDENSWDDDMLDDLMQVLHPQLIRHIAATPEDSPLRRAALRNAFIYMMRR